MASEKKRAVSDAGAWAMNIVSSVGIIMANKQVMSASGYNFRKIAPSVRSPFQSMQSRTQPMYLSHNVDSIPFHRDGKCGLHIVCSSYLPSKQVPFWDLFLFSLVSNTSIVGMNLSLMLNSVGFYQISKLSMIPVVCVLEWMLHSKTYTREVKLAVFVTMVGVGVCTVTDVHINLKGLLAALIAVITTSLQQIYIGALQKKHNCGSFELLSKTAPIQAASLLALGPFVDYSLNNLNVFYYKFSAGAIFFILLSCLLAVFCNMSQYLCIGRFSAVSFQVLGHMKTVCVLTLGWLLFDSVLTVKNLLGMSLAVLGMLIYSWAAEQAKQALTKAAPLGYIKEADFTEEDVALLKSGLEQHTKDIEVGREETK